MLHSSSKLRVNKDKELQESEIKLGSSASNRGKIGKDYGKEAPEDLSTEAKSSLNSLGYGFILDTTSICSNLVDTAISMENDTWKVAWVNGILKSNMSDQSCLSSFGDNVLPFLVLLKKEMKLVFASKRKRIEKF